jgi:hypothetical protein
MADIQGMFKWFKRLLWLLLLVLSVGIAAVAAFYFHLEKDLPDVSTLRDTTWETPLRVYSSDGVLMSEFGDVIEVRESSRSSAKFAKLTGAEAPVVALPAWLNRETGSLKGVVAKLPERSDIDYEVAEHLIVELYSK